MNTAWEPPSAAARDVIQHGAGVAMDPRPEWLDELYQAVVSAESAGEMVSDPVLAEGTRRANLSSLLQWAESNVRHPGARVAPNLSDDLLNIMRDLLRRDLDETTLETWRIGQNVVWRRWMEICFELTSDVTVLQEVLAVTSQSISAFIDDTISAVGDALRRERAELTSGTHAERRATVALLLKGAPVARAAAESKLGYALTGPHLAAVVWGAPGTAGEQLELAAELLVRHTKAQRRLTVPATGSSLWLWLPVSGTLSAADLDANLATIPDVRISLGRPRFDINGFRQSHLEAATVQRMMSQLSSLRQAGSYDDVQLVPLLSQDVGRADEFIADTLGALADSDSDLLATLRTYLAEQCNAARVAKRMFSHRNTIVRRLARCDELLPRPLAENPVSVGAALEMLWWRGGPTSAILSTSI